MNIVRHEKLEFFFSTREVIAALRQAFPNEFLLRRLPSDLRGVHVSTAGAGLLMTFEAKAVSPAEIEANRSQCVIENAQ